MKNWIFAVTLFLLSASSVFAHGVRDNYQNTRNLKVDVTIIDEYGYRLPLYDIEGKYRLKKSYLQALRGQQYAIEIRNKTNKRIGLVIAVDGRNIITGRPSYLKSHEKMYVLNPYEVSTYNGWRSSGNTVNRFYFTNENNSYAGAFNDHSAMGVIAVAAFHEKRPQYHNQHNAGQKPSKQRNARPKARQQPGTGWGDSEYSPATQVHFVPKKKSFAKHLIKYEWHKRLCEMGVIHCHRHSHSSSQGNRLWDEGDYAQPPKRYSRSKTWN